VWDFVGEDQFQKIQPVYLTGSSGIIIVIYAPRQTTLPTAFRLYNEVHAQISNVLTAFVINKMDLKHLYVYGLNERDLQKLKALQCPIVYTSAKSGEGGRLCF
jgi:GTPase SAR1 family protein